MPKNYSKKNEAKLRFFLEKKQDAETDARAELESAERKVVQSEA